MGSLKLRRDESWELDPIPFPGRVVSRVGRWDPQAAQDGPDRHGRQRDVLDSIGHAERALAQVEKHTRDLAGMIGFGADPDRPRAA
jgi:hypothetical protein